MLNRPSRFHALAGALLAVLGAAGAASAQAPISEAVRVRLLNVPLVAKWVKPYCSCYLGNDCPQGQTCGDYFTCTQSGKLDGVCKKVGRGSWPPPDLVTAAEGVDLYLQAFAASAQDIRGQHLEETVKALEDVQARRLTVEGHLAVQSLAGDVLDLTMGFDLVHPSASSCGVPGPAPTFRGHFSGPTRALFDAVREGVVAAIRANDPSRIEQPLRAFWKRYPGYKPDHTGRCYAHGHEDYPYDGALACQLAEITALLRVHLPNRDDYPRP